MLLLGILRWRHIVTRVAVGGGLAIRTVRGGVWVAGIGEFLVADGGLGGVGRVVVEVGLVGGRGGGACSGGVVAGADAAVALVVGFVEAAGHVASGGALTRRPGFLAAAK